MGVASRRSREDLSVLKPIFFAFAFLVIDLGFLGGEGGMFECAHMQSTRQDLEMNWIL